MPKGLYPLVLIINSDGSVEEIVDSEEINETDSKAVEVPPHGRLIDENNLVPLIEENYGGGVCKNKSDEERCLDRCKWAVLLNDIDSIPTVLEASHEC